MSSSALVSALVLLLAASASVVSGTVFSNPNGKYFDRIYVIVMENTDFSAAYADASFKAIADKGRILKNYHGTQHPSEPNYVSMIAGDPMGITDDSAYCLAPTAQTIVDKLEAAGVSWKSYNQKYVPCTSGTSACTTKSCSSKKCACSGTTCNLATTLGRGGSYARKHNPFMSFPNINQDSSRCAKIVGASNTVNDTSGNTLLDDINAGTVPQFVYYIPDLYNDCHDKPVGTAGYCGDWLKKNFFDDGGYFSKANAVDGTTLVVVNFDESAAGDLPPTGDLIYGALIQYGPPKPGMTSITPGDSCGAYYTHYSLLQLIEDNWNTGNLGRQGDDRTAAHTLQWGGPICVNSTSDCDTYAPNANAKCSCNVVGNTCP